MSDRSETNACLVVEDEPLAIEMMVDYIGRRKDLMLVGVVREFADFRQALDKHAPTIIFLDLVIPPGISNGFTYKELPKQASIIVVSAIPVSYYQGDLPESELFELPKPVSFDSFNRCVDAVLAKREGN